jgi:hypothetical protein
LGAKAYFLQFNIKELLAMVVCSFKRLGIDAIHQIQTAFPDLLVRIRNKEVYLELEVESKSFIKHKHHEQVQGLTKPIAVLCWFHNDDGVYEWYDFPARRDLEHFAVSLPETDLQSCLKLAERLRALIESTLLTLAGGVVVSASSSFGCTELYEADAKVATERL